MAEAPPYNQQGPLCGSDAPVLSRRRNNTPAAGPLVYHTYRTACLLAALTPDKHDNTFEMARKNRHKSLFFRYRRSPLSSTVSTFPLTLAVFVVIKASLFVYCNVINRCSSNSNSDTNKQTPRHPKTKPKMPSAGWFIYTSAQVMARIRARKNAEPTRRVAGQPALSHNEQTPRPASKYSQRKNCPSNRRNNSERTNERTNFLSLPSKSHLPAHCCSPSKPSRDRRRHYHC